MDFTWVELLGKVGLLVGPHPAVAIQNKKILTDIPDKFALATYAAAPISRRLYQMCESARACQMNPYKTVLAMCNDTAKPVDLRLGFDDLTTQEKRVLDGLPLDPFLHLIQPILFVIAGVRDEHLNQLNRIFPDQTIVIDRLDVASISTGSLKFDTFKGAA